MASYTVDYTKYAHNPALMRQMALKDVENYLGGKAKMKKMADQSVHDNVPRRVFIAGLELYVGIDGFPAEAWADSLGLVDEPVPPMEKMVDATVNYLFSVEKDAMETDMTILPDYIDGQYVFDRLTSESDFLDQVARKLKKAVEAELNKRKVASNPDDSTS